MLTTITNNIKKAFREWHVEYNFVWLNQTKRKIITKIIHAFTKKYIKITQEKEENKINK